MRIEQRTLGMADRGRFISNMIINYSSIVNRNQWKYSSKLYPISIEQLIKWTQVLYLKNLSIDKIQGFPLDLDTR